MTATKMAIYSNSSTGNSAQIVVDPTNFRVTLAVFNSSGRRVKLRQPRFSGEGAAREYANRLHEWLIETGFRTTQRR